MHSITGAFSSLSVNEPGCSRRPSNQHNSVSLPNLVNPEISSLKFLKNYSKFLCEDEVDSSDQPIDFSKKYAENKIAIEATPEPLQDTSESFSDDFKIYAETDLDLPTDYSLRYAENDLDLVQHTIGNKPENTEFVQDTIKSYYTEDTPHETPYTFSTSTSMSDLRIDDKVQRKRSISIGDNKLNQEKILVKSEYSSGLMSPEKPVNYCEEGTPGYFSRVASSGSLNSLTVNEPPKKVPTEVKEETQNEVFKTPRSIIKIPNEAKAVKFVEVVDYAEETPLMFSRSSSLASLDSIEQHSIHDDRSSVVSDLSRLTSGLVSPSELPDSPTQTVPPSPKPKKKLSFSIENKPELPTTASIFEDVVKNFKMENTPSLCSRATSLSSLTIDEIDLNENITEKKSTACAKNDLELSESSEDEDILAACINIGMQNNRYSHAQPSFAFNKPEIVISTPRNSPQVVDNIKNDDTGSKLDITNDTVRTYYTENTPAILSHAGSNSNLSLIIDSEINEEDEEKEPDEIISDVIDLSKINLGENHVDNGSSNCSRRTSFSSLSESSNEEDQSLLQECILAGMPKSNLRDNPEEADLNDEALLQECILEGMLINEIKGDFNESGSEEEDEYILANCINVGIKNNRYTHAITDKKLPTKDLNITGLQDGADSVTDNCPSSDEDDDRLLSDCVKIGMEKVSRNALRKSTNLRNQKLNISIERNISEADFSSSLSSISNDSCDSEQLLRECILSGMPKKHSSVEETELNETDKVLLQQCILEGMRKCLGDQRQTEDSNELSEEDQILLRKCILSGMHKTKKTAPSTSRNFTELTESDRALLQQCILAGMPKGSAKSIVNRNVIKIKKIKEPEHTCCIHCPRNQKRIKEASKLKNKQKTLVQIRESKNVNILYVSSQVLTVNQEFLRRPREEWI